MNEPFAQGPTGEVELLRAQVARLESQALAPVKTIYQIVVTARQTNALPDASVCNDPKADYCI